MTSRAAGKLKRLLKTVGRYFLRRLERPIPSYEQRIINNLTNLYRQIRPGDVLLVEGRSRLSRIIQLMTRSAWSHAALYIGDRLGDTDNPAAVAELSDDDGQRFNQYGGPPDADITNIGNCRRCRYDITLPGNRLPARRFRPTEQKCRNGSQPGSFWAGRHNCQSANMNNHKLPGW